MKRIWNKIGSNVKNGTFQKRAVDHVEKIERGEAKVLAPKYPGEKQASTTNNEEVKRDLDTKHVELIENMNKMEIKSTDPVERWTSTKDLPSRESEYLHRNDPVWEYGFYEPPVEKIPKGKLMFREALEILRANQELQEESNSQASIARKQQASEFLSTHAATSRVEAEKLDDIFEFFRPFERKDKQKVVNKHALAQLQEHLQGLSDQKGLLDGAKEGATEVFKLEKFNIDEYQKLDESEKSKVREAMAQLRQEEHERLNKRLAQIGEMESALKDAQKEAAEKLKNKDS